MVSLKTRLKIFLGKIALNESRPKKEKMKNARRQADEAKTVLSVHKKEKPEYHEKAVVKDN